MKTSEKYVEMPEIYGRRKLNELYRAIPLKDTTSRLMRKYFSAMANLYGIITLEKAYEIITDQCPSLITQKEFFAFAEIARHEDSAYFILGQCDLYFNVTNTPFKEYEIIDAALIADDELELYHGTLYCQQEKPFYIPKKSKLLLYADDTYCEETAELSALRSFFLTKMKLNEVKTQMALVDICFSSRYMDEDATKEIERLRSLGIRFGTKNVEQFIQLYSDFHNHARMQCNRGYTPQELFEMLPPERRVPKSISFGPNIRKSIANGTMDAEELMNDILTMDLPNEELRFNFLKELADIRASITASKKKAPEKKVKVGRNDPCPCGSGKKYKHCCGR